MPDIPACRAKGPTTARVLTDINLAIEVEMAKLLGRGDTAPAPRRLLELQNDERYTGCEWFSVHINIAHVRAVASHQAGRWS